MELKDRMEYRAVFEGPDGMKYYGSKRDSINEALQDHAPRSEETLAVLIGIECRKKQPWRLVSLHSIIEKASEV